MRALIYFGEVLIGYGPIMVLWLVGIGMGLPFSVAAIAGGELIGYLMLLSIILGCIGIWGVVQLIKKLLWPGIGYPIRQYRNHLIIGSVAVVPAAIEFVGVNNWISLYFMVPVLVTFHLYRICGAYS